MSTITWLHLSDLHLQADRLDRWDQDNVLVKLLDDLSGLEESKRLKPDLILVTGDITFRAQPAEYALAQEFFDQLLKITRLPKERLCIVPGNHDVNRKRIRPSFRNLPRGLQNRQGLWEMLDCDRDREELLQRFDHYVEFVEGYFDGNVSLDDEFYSYSKNLDLRGYRVEVLGLNSAWLAYGGHDDKGFLALSEHQVQKALSTCGSADVRLALMHHPLDWLFFFDKDDCEHELRRNCNIVLSGHLHEPSALGETDGYTYTLFFSAGACYQEREHENSYSVARLDQANKVVTQFKRKWVNTHGGFWTEDTQSHRGRAMGPPRFPLDLGYPQDPRFHYDLLRETSSE